MVIYDPPRSAWAQLQSTWPSGLVDIASRLEAQLQGDWEVFLRPPVNGLFPDLVVLNVNAGVVVLQVCESRAPSHSELSEATRRASFVS